MRRRPASHPVAARWLAAGLSVSAAAVGAWAWGEASGFFLYLLLLPAAVASWRRRRGAGGALPGAVAAMLGVAAYGVLLRHVPPLWSLSPATLDLLRGANAIGAMALATGLMATMGGVAGARQNLATRRARDPLTGVLHRSGWLAAAARWQQAVGAAAEPGVLGVLMVDVDHLGAINELHGQQIGDQALKTVAAALRQGLREGDLLGRWAGDVFIIAMRTGEVRGLRMAAERLRALVQAAELRAGNDGEWLALSASLGGAVGPFDEAIEALIGRAEEALRAARSEGRARLRVTPMPE